MSLTLQVHFHAKKEGDFDAVLKLFTAGGAVSHLSVTAAVVAPSLALTPNLLDLGVTHLGVTEQRILTLSNLTMLPTSFSWEAYGSGGDDVGGGQLEVTIDPPQGVIEPGQSALVRTMNNVDGVTVTPCGQPMWSLANEQQCYGQIW